MPEKKTGDQPKKVPFMCAFDKDRPCNETCTAFLLLQAGGGYKWGCSRMGGIQ